MNTLFKVYCIIAAMIIFFAFAGNVLRLLELDQCEDETGRECVMRAVPVEFDQ